jgi:hypothetical protein
MHFTVLVECPAGTDQKSVIDVLSDRLEPFSAVVDKHSRYAEP